MTVTVRKPDFLIIGAQKAGTTWLWEMLKNHPGTSLPTEKEIHFFGSSELYKYKGLDWYFEHFRGCDGRLVTGEASTTYLSDKLAFFYNVANKLEYDESLPLLPELVASTFPRVKIIVSLRDPVRRAISAYFHYMRKGKYPVSVALARTAADRPRLRLIEMGDYVQHLGAWLRVFPREQVLILVFERDIIDDRQRCLETVYEFLGLDPGFVPPDPDQSVHKSWNWTRIVANYYAGPLRRTVNSQPIAGFLNRHDFLARYAVNSRDLDFLRAAYLPQREPLRDMIGDVVDRWTYGEELY
jgi:hypothetical protein